MSADIIVPCTAIAAALAAAAIDLRTRRIPNIVTASIACAGLALAAAGFGRLTLAAAVGGGLVGLLLMLPSHLLGRTGAGDVKLLAALGTLLGPAAVATAFLATLIAGGVLALAVAAYRLGVRGGLGDRTFPYGPAIACGTFFVVVGGWTL